MSCFFFKHKTAYEMRISDWSSDVCSSDLPMAEALSAHAGPAAFLIGPEGGFDEEERAAIRAHPATVPVSLGPRILRAETAAISATAIWMAQRGDWAGEVHIGSDHK